MEEQNVLEFSNKLINTFKKKEIRNIGIITDKDGTIMLDNSLKKILKKYKEENFNVNIYVIVNSRRSIKDMINCINDENIPIDYFDYIIGDNGALCYDVKNRIQLYKKVIEKRTAYKIINKFIQIGGTLENVRLTNSENIIAYPSENVKKYYKNVRDIIFNKQIELFEKDITKITFTGSKKLIEEINNYILKEIKGFKTHIGTTSFPTKEKNNYRLDLTRYVYKRKSCKLFKRKTRY